MRDDRPESAVMPDPGTFALFALASVALLLVPGPSVLFVVARTLEHGRAAGLITVLGVEAGALTHALAAAAGLSALLAASAPACTALRVAGAGYLLWLAAGALRIAAAGAPTREAGRPAVSRGRLFAQAALVDLLNVKTALFFIAFLPAFVDPARGSVGGQFALLGACFVALALVIDGAYALVASRLVGRVRDGRRLARCGAVAYLGLAALTLYPLVAASLL